MSETEKAAPNKTLMIIIGVLIALAVGAGVYYARGGFSHGDASVAEEDKIDPDLAELMQPGPLPDM